MHICGTKVNCDITQTFKMKVRATTVTVCVMVRFTFLCAKFHPSW